MPFSSEKNWKNVSSSRSKKREWGDEGDNSGVKQERAEELQAGVNKPIGQVLSETWENLKKIPGDIEKGMKK